MACGGCQRYKSQNYNYCRMCGAALNAGFAKTVRVAGGYMTNEKFCGNCGGDRFNCPCTPPAAPPGQQADVDDDDQYPDKPRVPWWQRWLLE